MNFISVDEWEDKARKEGRTEGRRQVLHSVLAARFGSADPNLDRALDRLVSMPDDEAVSLVMRLSPEELLARLGLT